MQNDKDDIYECKIPYWQQVWFLRPALWCGLCVLCVIVFYLLFPVFNRVSNVSKTIQTGLEKLSPVEVKWKWPSF